MADDELRLLQWLREQRKQFARTARAPAWTPQIDLGDDMAALSLDDGKTILLGTDMLLDGSHFDSKTHSLAQIGAKAVFACLSDCAAMAAQPVAILVSLALPRDRVWTLGQPLMDSIMTAAEQFQCPVIGGDTTSWAGPLAIDITTLARAWPGLVPVRRDGARVGDDLYVTGPLGGSIRRKHLAFSPRIEEARQLALTLGAELHAMIDISDGLALDLYRMCSASGCGALIDEGRLTSVTSADAQLLAEQDGRSAVEHALSDGEDYELLCAVSAQARSTVERLDVALHLIGSTTAQGLALRRSSGQTVDLQPQGYVH